jgi:DNA-binding transcriptional ArsR family regulator
MDDSDAVDAFGTLADETRLAILRALALADGPVRFSDLRERVGVRDTGRFNYHLSQLRERFVEKRDDGYVLGATAERLVADADDRADTEFTLELASPW